MKNITSERHAQAISFVALFVAALAAAAHDARAEPAPESANVRRTVDRFTEEVTCVIDTSADNTTPGAASREVEAFAGCNKAPGRNAVCLIVLRIIRSEREYADSELAPVLVDGVKGRMRVHLADVNLSRRGYEHQYFLDLSKDLRNVRAAKKFEVKIGSDEIDATEPLRMLKVILARKDCPGS